MLAMSLCHYQYVNAEDCENDIQGLNIECMVYMQKIGGQINPSDRCCDVIKTANVPCVCKNGLSRKLSTFCFLFLNTVFSHLIYYIFPFNKCF